MSLTKTYAIRAKEEATALDVIASTFTLFDIDVIALIDPRSTHYYICTTLATEKKMFIEFIEFDIKVLNPIGQCVIVNKVCKNCPLKIKGLEFRNNLMLLPSNELDVIFENGLVNRT